MKEEFLTQEIVKEKDWNKLKTITADMLSGYTSIEHRAFYRCTNLISIVIPNSVTSIENGAFFGCNRLISVVIPSSVTYIGYYAFGYCFKLTSVTIPISVVNIGCNAFCCCKFNVGKKYDDQGRLIAYKGFNYKEFGPDMIYMACRDFKYKEGNTYEMDGEIELCRRGFHACINPMDCFDYYCGEINKDVIYHEVYLENVSDEIGDDSKVVAGKITIGRKITLSEMADIASGKK